MTELLNEILSNNKIIYENVYPYVADVIKNDIDDLYKNIKDIIDKKTSKHIKCKKSSKNIVKDTISTKNIFKDKPYAMHINGLMSYNVPPNYTLYSSYLGLGCHFLVNFNIDSKMYILTGSEDGQIGAIIFKSINWNDVCDQIDIYFSDMRNKKQVLV
jgi:hypothetical protein